jgi:hypothetical protein
LDVRVVEHATHILHIHFNYKISSSDNVHAKGM